MLTAAAVATPAQAQVPEDKWTFQAILYAYFPHIGGSTSFPDRTGGSGISVNSNELISNLNFTFMGTVPAVLRRHRHR